MTSPWKDSNAAFFPMYDESVVISGSRPNGNFTQTIQVAFFVDFTGDPISDETMDTEREDIHLVCRVEDVAFLLKLRRGDTIERTAYNGVKYRIKEVKNDSVMGWVITARSV